MSIYKPKSQIAFDIDGIILDTGTEIWNVITSHLGLPWSIERWTNYYIEDVVGHPIDSLRPVYEEVLWRQDLPAVPGAAWVLQKFYENTREPILLITARRPQFVESAFRSIQKAAPDVPFEVVGTSKSRNRIDNQSGHNKTDFLKNHNIKLFIDDYPYSWEQYIDNGINIATLDWPWTRAKAKSVEKNKPNQFIMHKNWTSLGSYLALALNLKRFQETGT